METNMKLARNTKTLGIAILAVLASPYAMADDFTAWDSSWYVGANLGKSKAKVDDSKIANNLKAGGFTMTSISDKGSDNGYKIFGGYLFSQNFALEGGYFDLGKQGFTAFTSPPGSLNGTIKVKGWNLDLVGILPFTPRFSAFGRIGLDYAKADDSFTGTGFVSPVNPSPSKRSTNYKLGLGLQYDFTQHLGMRLEAERYRVNDAVNDKGDIDLLSLGLVWRFGGDKPAATRTSSNSPPAAEPVRKVAPAPVLVVVPIAAPTQQYCSILDIQFEINQEDIQRQEKDKLGVVGTFMNKYPNTTAVIEGHTDNVGTDAQNLELSQDRAESVVKYLEDNSHIAANRLSSVGYGDTRPIADNGTQAGQRLNRRIDAVIACATDVEGLTVKPARVTMAMLIEYDQNKADVKPQYHDELLRVANFMKANPTVTATVEGHTGNLQATPELAMQISQLRAQNVVNYLADNFGIARSRLSAEGFGDNRRFAYNTSLEGQQENRRVNIILNYPN
jgi:OOP family OmpA-OmpF porin